MDPQPMGKVRDLSRLAGRVAARSTVRWSSLWNSWESVSSPPSWAARP